VAVHVETLTSGWDSSHGTVFGLDDLLVEQLTELAQAHDRVQNMLQEAEAGTASDGENEQAWDEAANDAPQVETRETLLEAVGGGVAAVGQRPERRCRRQEPYGR
jgi:hypothetical protein